MDYAGFSRPLWQWLERPEPVRLTPGPFTPFPSFGATSMVAAMRAFAAARPWRATAHSLTLVGSHDVPRIATFLDGDQDLITVAFGLLASMPGIPMLWAGDEIGQQGVNGEDGRRPFPWHDTTQWDLARFATNRALFTARAGATALRHGGLRWLAVADDAVTFLREAPTERVWSTPPAPTTPPSGCPAPPSAENSPDSQARPTSTPTPTAPSPFRTTVRRSRSGTADGLLPDCEFGVEPFEQEGFHACVTSGAASLDEGLGAGMTRAWISATRCNVALSCRLPGREAGDVPRLRHRPAAALVQTSSALRDLRHLRQQPPARRCRRSTGAITGDGRDRTPRPDRPGPFEQSGVFVQER